MSIHPLPYKFMPKVLLFQKRNYSISKFNLGTLENTKQGRQIQDVLLILQKLQCWLHFLHVLIGIYINLEIGFTSMNKSRSPMKDSKMKAQQRKRQRDIASKMLNKECQKEVQKKFEQFKNHQRYDFIKTRLMGFLGKNYTIDYKHHYNFKQQWESKQTPSELRHTSMLYENKITLIISIVVMLIYALTIWARSIEFVFMAIGQVRVLIQIYYLTIFCQVSDAAMRVWVEIKDGKMLTSREIILKTYNNIVSVVYLCLCIADLYDRGNAVWWLLEGVNIYFLYGRASELYQYLRLKNFALQYEYQFKLFDLILNLIIIAHTFAVILYLAGNSGYEESWTSSLGLQYQNQFVKYLYSFYFCTTTILTVGYGDISPKNHLEVGVVVCVEIMGIVMFGYLLNEIGYTVNILRRSRQTVQKNLVTLDKMRHYYKIDDELMEKGRTYLINQSDRTDHLSPEEENSLMMKFNEDLRNKIYMENSLSVIKSSIFFLCRWSKCMQAAVSTRLQHILFAPEEILYQPAGKQRLYIVRMGKVQVFAEKKGSRKSINNSLKTIEVGLDQQVSDNTYGLTALASARKVNLSGVAKVSTSCYFIEKDKFMECIYERLSDFEYFHEIKLKYQLQTCPESLEVPKIKNSKHHFDPSVRSAIIRHGSPHNAIKNRRRRHIRSNKSELFEKHKLLVDNKYVQRLNTLIYKSMEVFPTCQVGSDEIIMEQTSKGYPKCEESTFLKQMMIRKSLTIPASQEGKVSEYSFSEKTGEFKGELHHYFETGKEYTNYFILSNKTNVLKRYELEYSTITNEENSKSSTWFRF